MKIKLKTQEFINAVCSSREKDLVGKSRLVRMADAESLQVAFEILKESAFGGENTFAFGDYDKLIDQEEKRLLEFVKEYTPSEEILNYCLIPYDFYNAEVIVKSISVKSNYQNLIQNEGLFTIEQLLNAVNGNAEGMPKQLVCAINESKLALEEGKGGMVVGGIFARRKFEYLQKVVKTKYLKELLQKQIDGLNLCALLRAGDYDLVSSQIISGGTINKNQMQALASRNEKQIAVAFNNHYLQQEALKGANAINQGKPLIDTERALSSMGADRMEEGKYTEQSGTYPFMRYYYKRKNEIACVRTVLTGKANSLDTEQIKRRLITV